MRSKWMWAALALVAVLGITTAASATTRGLITGKQIANYSINSKKLVNHTIQKHDLSNRLVKSLHGAKGARGPAGPQGPAGPEGATGPTGVVDTKMFAGPLPSVIPGETVEPSFGEMVGPSVIVTTTSTQKLVGSAVAVLGSTKGTYFGFGLCYQASGATQPIAFADWNGLFADSTANRLPYAAAATVTPGAGTWEVGYCVNNLGSNFLAGDPANPLDNNGFVNGWVQVVN